MELLNARQDIADLIEDKDFVFLDLETNGLSVSTEILEVGAIRCSGKTILDPEDALDSVEEFHHLVYFDGEPNWDALNVNKLDPEYLRCHGSQLEDVLRELVDFTRDTLVVGHNIISFDLPILDHHLQKHRLNLHYRGVADTKRLAKNSIHVPSYRLADLSSHFNLPVLPTHRAIDDVRATAHLFRQLMMI